MTNLQLNQHLPYALTGFRQLINQYHKISDSTWQKLSSFCSLTSLSKDQVLYQQNDIPDSLSFIHTGLFRLFITNESGEQYNKNFFSEQQLVGSLVALINQCPSEFTVQALEDAVVLTINYKQYRKLLMNDLDLMRFHIIYIERHWLMAKDKREVEMVMENASQRYERFTKERSDVYERLPKYHIASHLGITPTQLSRIRKAKNQPM